MVRMHKYVFLSLFVVLVVLTGLAGPCWATSATVSASGSSGPVSITASASFTSYTECDDSDPPICTTDDSGTLSVYKGSEMLGAVSGNGSASWSGEIEGAVLANGEYFVRAVATDSRNETAEMETSFFVQNPKYLDGATDANPTGPIDVSGEARFLVYQLDDDGCVRILKDQLNGTVLGGQCYDYPIVKYYHLQNMIGHLQDVANWSNGDHTIIVLALAPNSEIKRVDLPITIENPISLTASGPISPDGPIDVTGSAQFIEYLADDEGTINIYKDTLDLPYLIGSKSCDQASVSFSLDDMNGELQDVANWNNGDHTIIVQARAANNNTKRVDLPITIENPISLSASAPATPTGPVDVTGSAGFMEYLAGDEGSIEIYGDSLYQSSLLGSKSYDSPNVSFSLSDMNGSLHDVANLLNGEHSFIVLARAVNGGWKRFDTSFTVESTMAGEARAPDQRPYLIPLNIIYFARCFGFD